MNNGIDPKIGMWMNVGFLILTGVAAGTVTFVGLPAQTVAIIKSAATDAAFMISCVNVVFHAYSSPVPGPGVK